MTRPVRCIECGHDAHHDGLCDECARVSAAPWCRRGISGGRPDRAHLELRVDPGQPVTDAPGALARESAAAHPTAKRPSRAVLGALGADPAPPNRPVIRCSRCGDPLPFGRIGRCDACIGRGGNPIGCLALAVVALLLAFAVIVALVARTHGA